MLSLGVRLQLSIIKPHCWWKIFDLLIIFPFDFTKKLFFFSDNPHVDIVGANLYDRFIKNKDGNGNASEIPISRIISEGEHLHEQCAEEMHSILVGTGVYKHIPESEKSTSDSEKKEVYHGHRDIAHEPHLTKPSKFVHNVHEGIQYIFRNEGISFNQ